MTIKTPKIKMICFPRKKIKMTHLHMELQELRKQKLRKGNWKINLVLLKEGVRAKETKIKNKDFKCLEPNLLTMFTHLEKTKIKLN